MTSLLKSAPPLAHDRVVLDYDQRLMRRKLLTTQGGRAFLVDLPSVTNLDNYWGFLVDGLNIEIVPAPEAVLVITGDLTRLAWHIGNRHTLCQILPDRLVIREDHVLERMLTGLGATIRRESLPFKPEGGAYGHGRTMGHSHGDDPDGARFGWHHHGDGQMHFHASKGAT
ncbi:MAG: urease accessory protein UreE [Tabrizicola flagellatus]|uniref:urease accessory protein UreE n=1 Tax=Tabrizicola flagellatus TaxID=2593021 RepID=UPI0039196589